MFFDDRSGNLIVVNALVQAAPIFEVYINLLFIFLTSKFTDQFNHQIKIYRHLKQAIHRD